MAAMIGGIKDLKIQPFWEKSPERITKEITSMPVGGAGAVGSFGVQAAKYAAVAGAGALVAAFGLSKGMEQQQEQEQRAWSTGGGVYNYFNIPEGYGGDLTINPTGGASSTAQQQDQSATQQQKDYTGLIIAGVIGLGAIMLLGRK